MDFTAAGYQIILVFDAVIVAILLALLWRSRKRHAGRLNIDLLKLKALRSSLDKALEESQRSSAMLFDVMASHRQDLNGLLKEIDIRTKELRLYLDESQKLLERLGEASRQKDTIVDPYTQAAELVSIGLPADDIKRRCGISLNEIDLIMQIERNRAQ